jgi:hypothetical protein
MAALFATKEIRHDVAGCGFVKPQQDVVVAVENGDIGRHWHPFGGDRNHQACDISLNVPHDRFYCKRKSDRAPWRGSLQPLLVGDNGMRQTRRGLG